ncbi:hypothetical protein [Rodentibacter genomosp. 2]
MDSGLHSRTLANTLARKYQKGEKLSLILLVFSLKGSLAVSLPIQ